MYVSLRLRSSQQFPTVLASVSNLGLRGALLLLLSLLQGCLQGILPVTGL